LKWCALLSQQFGDLYDNITEKLKMVENIPSKYLYSFFIKLILNKTIVHTLNIFCIDRTKVTYPISKSCPWPVFPNF